MAKQQRRSDCPINYAVELFGDKWSFLILRDLAFKGKHYYVEFLNAGEGIATNILADKLALMEKENIVVKQVDPAHGSKFIYWPTSAACTAGALAGSTEARPGSLS